MPSHPHHAESRFFNVAVALTHAMEELPPAYPWSGDSLLSSLQPPRQGPAEDMEEALSEYHASEGGVGAGGGGEAMSETAPCTACHDPSQWVNGKPHPRFKTDPEWTWCKPTGLPGVCYRCSGDSSNLGRSERDKQGRCISCGDTGRCRFCAGVGAREVSRAP